MRRHAFYWTIIFVILLQAPFVSAIATGGDPPGSISVTTSNANGNYVVSWTIPLDPGLTSAARVPLGLISFAGIISLYQYRLEEQKNGGAWVSVLHNSSFLSYSITGQSDGSYKYRVMACTFFQCSIPRVSSTVVVNTAPPPPPPSNSNRVIFIHTDVLGSPAVETDENGEIIQ